MDGGKLAGIIIAFFAGALIAKNWQRIKSILPFIGEKAAEKATSEKD